jgi:hypothetical protein
VIASTTPVAAATAPTCECIVRHETGADDNDCCQYSEGISKHGLSSCHVRAQQYKARSDRHPKTVFDDERIEA